MHALNKVTSYQTVIETTVHLLSAV